MHHSTFYLLRKGFCKMAATAAHKDVLFADLLNWVKTRPQSLLVLDVRKKEELVETGAIPGSKCVPHTEVKAAFDPNVTSADEFKSKYGFDRPGKDVGLDMVVTCRSGRRVGFALEDLEKLGYHGLSAYRGSWLDWSANGGPVEKVQ